jgi:hypothetical protein
MLYLNGSIVIIQTYTRVYFHKMTQSRRLKLT